MQLEQFAKVLLAIYELTSVIRLLHECRMERLFLVGCEAVPYAVCYVGLDLIR